MEDIGLYCIDEKDKPPDSYIHSSGLCPVLGIDERYGQFQGTRSWPSSFMMLVDQNNRTAKVYNRPVFVSTVSSRQGFPSLIMFLGKRWAILDSSLIKKRPFQDWSNKQDLVKYLNNDFHGYWSNFEVAFLSEPVFESNNNVYVFVYCCILQKCCLELLREMLLGALQATFLATGNSTQKSKHYYYFL